MTLRAVPALVVPTARAMPWPLFLAGAGLGLVIVAIPSATTVSLRDQDLASILRAAATCGALGAAFLLDDPAASTIATVPTRRLVRRLARIALAATALAVWWAAVLVITVAGAQDGAADTLPLAGLTVEAAAQGAVALALAAVNGSGVFAAPGVLLLAVGALLLPARYALYVPPGSDAWPSAHDRWAVLLAVALTATVYASHEPVRPLRLHRWR